MGISSLNLLRISFPPTDHLMNDFQTHTSYIAKREVDLLPLRRTITKTGKLRDAVILLRDLQPEESSLLLRVKHVAIDFTMDFAGNPGIVPGARFVAKIPSMHPIRDGEHMFSPADKLLVFPYSACWLQNRKFMCNNCISASACDVEKYVTHQRTPCLRQPVYGRQLNGGLQDYIRVPSPAHSLVKVPESVSGHDCCFLFDVALPFLSYCVDVMFAGPGANSQSLPDSPGRVLIMLNDVKKEANDCLLVIRHLQLDHSIFTFTDPKLLAKPQTKERFRDKFRHVLVFTSDKEILESAVQFAARNVSKDVAKKSTIGIFRNISPEITCPNYCMFHKIDLSYKDRFLMEDLLMTLAALNGGTRSPVSPTQQEITIQHGKSASKKKNGNSASTSPTSDMSKSSITEIRSSNSSTTRSSSQSTENKNDEDQQSDEISSNSSTSAPKHTSWLHCDKDFRLCSDDNCVHDVTSLCHQTATINEMIRSGCSWKRVFYTHRSACHVKLNAFIF
ncbi:hypothetical protein OXX79_002573 [Metschnikowia pulcherrima]